MLITFPDKYLTPSYNLSPFRTLDISLNNKFPKSDFVDNYFDARFGSGHYKYLNNGRDALNFAISYFQLKKTDFITIFTTSGNRYISKCVTNVIQKYCNWTRTITYQTKLILIIHEFGFPF